MSEAAARTDAAPPRAKKPAKVAGQIPHTAYSEPALIPESEQRFIPWNQIVASKLNPRKVFDDADLAQLAQSIAEQGVEQPLLCRPASAGFLELAAGERRYRAIGVLIATGRAPETYPVPVIVRQMTDAQLIEAALVENMQRADLSAVEEGNAFAALQESGMAVAGMPKRFGKSLRYIEQRLQLVKAAAPEVQAAVAAGKIDFAQARGLLAAAPRDQVTILQHVLDKKQGYITEPEIKIAAIGGLPEVSEAMFDQALYTGTFYVNDDGTSYFQDHAQFGKLQREEVRVQAAAEADKPGVAWVEIYDFSQRQEFNDYDFKEVKGHDLAGTVFVIDRRSAVKVHRNLVRVKDLNRLALEAPPKPRTPADASATAGDTTATTSPAAKKGAAQGRAGAAPTAPAAVPPKDTPKDPSDAFTPAHRVHAHIRKTEALQRAVLADPLMASRIACLALLTGGDFNPSKIGTISAGTQGFKDEEEDVIAADVQKALRVVPPEKGDRVKTWWTWLCGLKAPQLQQVMAALVAETIGTWCHYNTPLGDHPHAVMLAQSLGIAGKEAKHGLGLELGDLEHLRQPALLAIGRKLGTLGLTTETPVDTLRDRIGQSMKLGATLALPTLTFGTDTEIATGVKDLMATPAPKDVHAKTAPGAVKAAKPGKTKPETFAAELRRKAKAKAASKKPAKKGRK